MTLGGSPAMTLGGSPAMTLGGSPAMTFGGSAAMTLGGGPAMTRGAGAGLPRPHSAVVSHAGHHSFTPRCSATAKISLSPRPQRFIRMIWSGAIAGASFIT